MRWRSCTRPKAQPCSASPLHALSLQTAAVASSSAPRTFFSFFPLPRDCLPRSIAPPSSPPTPLRLPCPRPAPAMLYEPSREVFERSIDEDWDDWLALWLL